MGALLLGWVVLAGLPADEPAKSGDRPPWQRLLGDEDRAKAATLENEMGVLQNHGKYNEALEKARALLELRSKAQGEDHWETTWARWTLEELQRLREKPKE